MTRNQRIRSLDVYDFRAIRGGHELDLDAPIVLIHGHNGAGKTSLLSALELALTGSISFLERSENSGYRRHLNHVDADSGVIRVRIEGVPDSAPSTRTTLTPNGINGQPALNKKLRALFSERSFLPQATLGKLLDIYAPSNPDGPESSLIQFIKQLTKLDDLEALIEGLAPAADIRNARKLSPTWQRKHTEQLAEQDLVDGQSRTLAQRKANIDRDVRDLERALNIHYISSKTNPQTILSSRISAIDERREALRNAANDLTFVENLIGRQSLEVVVPGDPTSDEPARPAAEWWRENAASLLSWMAEIRDVLPEQIALDPLRPEETTAQLLADAFKRLESLKSDLASGETARRKLLSVQLRITKNQQRLGRLEATKSPADIEGHATLLDAIETLLPLAADDRCPLCDQEFASGGLAKHVQGKIALAKTQLNKSLRARASLERATNELAIASAELVDLSRAPELALDPELLQAEVVRLERLLLARESMAEEASRVQIAIDHLEALRQKQTSLAVTSELADRADKQLRQIAQSAGLKVFFSVSVGESSRSIRSAIDSESNSLAIEANKFKELRPAAQRVGEYFESFSANRARASRVDALDRDLVEARRRKDAASALLRTAETVRLEVIRSVLGKELNGLWRELFTRLAPTEPFIPQFSDIDEGAFKGLALETIDRRSRISGTPAAMLSYGNVNTAALTLFLALHFTDEDSLPWLILDDPVQSMDDVHIANFAALVRQLAREQNRQVILAVHNKELFDYLTLELAPASVGDRLITYSLERDRGGKDTSITKEVLDYEVEPPLIQEALLG